MVTPSHIQRGYGSCTQVNTVWRKFFDARGEGEVDGVTPSGLYRTSTAREHTSRATSALRHLDTCPIRKSTFPRLCLRFQLHQHSQDPKSILTYEEELLRNLLESGISKSCEPSESSEDVTLLCRWIHDFYLNAAVCAG